MTCTTCSAGKYCPDEAAAETDCPDGFYAPAGQATCTACEPGKECSDKTQSTDCAAGTYSFGLQTSCTAAGAGRLIIDHRVYNYFFISEYFTRITSYLSFCPPPLIFFTTFLNFQNHLIS